MCPEAQMRRASPSAASRPPSPSDNGKGSARTRASRPATYPPATRNLEGMDTRPLQATFHRLRHRLRGDRGHHTVVDGARAAVTGRAGGHGTDDLVIGREGAVAYGIG